MNKRKNGFVFSRKVLPYIGALLLLFSSFSYQSVYGAPVFDGVITDNEYSNSLIVFEGKFELYWTINETEGILYIGIVGYTLGWVAIGFDPTSMMQGADMYFGYFAEGEGVAIYAYSDGPTGPHPRDTDKGGTDDILSYSVKETSNATIFEFSRKLVTNDHRDKDIVDKDMKVIWALGPSDDWTSSHGGNRGSFTVNFFEENTGQTLQTSTAFTSFVPLYSFFGFLLAVVYVKHSIIRTKNKK